MNNETWKTTRGHVTRNRDKYEAIDTDGETVGVFASFAEAVRVSNRETNREIENALRFVNMMQQLQTRFGRVAYTNGKAAA